MSEVYTGQLIVITGAASGIGRATALKLARRGADLVLVDIDPKVADVAATCREISGSGHNAAVVDVSNSKHCEQYILEATHGRKIDHVFNCAGVNPTALLLEDTTEEYFDKLLTVNVKGIYNVTKLSIPYMKEGGSFVNVSSICGLHPAPKIAIYCATKYAVIGFSKSMALELGPKGIRVNVIAPGYINTPTNQSVIEGGDAIQKIEAKIAVGRMGTPDDIADTVVFMMSKGATYMNGSVIEVNGGTG